MLRGRAPSGSYYRVMIKCLGFGLRGAIGRDSMSEDGRGLFRLRSVYPTRQSARRDYLRSHMLRSCRLESQPRSVTIVSVWGATRFRTHIWSRVSSISFSVNLNFNFRCRVDTMNSEVQCVCNNRSFKVPLCKGRSFCADGKHVYESSSASEDDEIIPESVLSPHQNSEERRKSLHRCLRCLV